MRAQRNARLPAGLKVQELLLAVLKWLQKVFSTQNRALVCYLVLLAVVLTVASGLRPGHATLPGWLGRAFHRDFLAAKLPFMAGFWGVALGLLALFWLLTQPAELRPRRWIRIGLSLSLVYLLRSELGKTLDLTFVGSGHNTFTFLGFLLPAALLAATWAPVLTWYLGAAFTVLMDSPANAEPEPSLKPAYEAVQAGQPRMALRLIRPMLRADFHHYEALALAACLHRHLNQRWRMQLAVLRALKNPELLEAQRARLLDMMAHQEEAEHDCWQIPGRAWAGAAPNTFLPTHQTAG